ncbi:MAG: Gfo/Idh/MocA family oxidoreductase [Phycisphaerales bacterium]|nr:Gfo/Idh/MocA family oxidoreductase [Phycisphaerales bacterium]
MVSSIAVLGTAHPHVMHVAHEIHGVPGAKLIGVYDEDPARLKEAADQLKVPAFSDLAALLALKPKLALVGSVPCDRAMLAERALRAGASVLVDKPLALSHDHLEKVKQAAKDSGKRVMVLYPYRGHPLVRAARRALREGRIGKLVRIFAAGPHKVNAPTRPAWFWHPDQNGGIFVDIGSHHIDFCCWMADQSPIWVSAIEGNFDQPNHPQFRDFGQAMMRFESGMMAHVEVDWLNPISMRNFGDTRFWLSGTKGKIELRLGDEACGHIWTEKAAGEVLAGEGPDMGQWTNQLIENLLNDRPVEIEQDEVWRTSAATLLVQKNAIG